MNILSRKSEVLTTSTPPLSQSFLCSRVFLFSALILLGTTAVISVSLSVLLTRSKSDDVAFFLPSPTPLIPTSIPTSSSLKATSLPLESHSPSAMSTLFLGTETHSPSPKNTLFVGTATPTITRFNTPTFDAYSPGYDIIFVGGQSNAVGRASCYDPSSDAADPRVFQLGRYSGREGRVVQAIEPLDHFRKNILECKEGEIPCVCNVTTPNQDSDCEMMNRECSNPFLAQPYTRYCQFPRFGFSIRFANHFAQTLLSPARKVLILPGAIGGSSMHSELVYNWNTSVGPAFLNAKKTIDMALNSVDLANLSNRIVAYLWIQGEADTPCRYYRSESCNASAAVMEYASRLDRVVLALRKKFIPRCSQRPFHCCWHALWNACAA
mmetsp:Transcript_5505/g.8549  ORF Transcript_5505/g.8549 Transcript_5505/m.8549 type:complete len:381 (+) Transcript_5505:230-1372(+)